MATLPGCNLLPETQNYELTLNMSVDGLVHSASVVQQVHCHKGVGAFGGMDAGGCYVNGEALPLDLGKRGKIFLILRDGPRRVGTPGRTLGDVEKMVWHLGIGGDDRVRNRKCWTPAMDRLPAFVAFQDRNDPKTVVQVDPDNLQPAFGDRVTFDNLWVCRTSKPVTRGRIERELPWLTRMGMKGRSSQLDGGFGQILGGPISQWFSKIDFER